MPPLWKSLFRRNLKCDGWEDLQFIKSFSTDTCFSKNALECSHGKTMTCKTAKTDADKTLKPQETGAQYLCDRNLIKHTQQRISNTSLEDNFMSSDSTELHQNPSTAAEV